MNFRPINLLTHLDDVTLNWLDKFLMQRKS